MKTTLDTLRKLIREEITRSLAEAPWGGRGDTPLDNGQKEYSGKRKVIGTETVMDIVDDNQDEREVTIDYEIDGGSPTIYRIVDNATGEEVRLTGSALERVERDLFAWAIDDDEAREYNAREAGYGSRYSPDK